MDEKQIKEYSKVLNSIKNNLEDLSQKFHTHRVDEHADLNNRYTKLESDFKDIAKRIEDQISLKRNIDILQSNINKLESEVKFLKEEFTLIKQLITTISTNQTDKFDTLQKLYEKLQTHNIQRLKEDKKNLRTGYYWNLAQLVSIFLAAIGLLVSMVLFKAGSMESLSKERTQFMIEVQTKQDQAIKKVEDRQTEKLEHLKEFFMMLHKLKKNNLEKNATK